MGPLDDKPEGGRDLSTWGSGPGRRLADAALAGADWLRSRLDERAIGYVVLGVTALLGLVLTALLTAASAEIYDNVTDTEGIAWFDRPVLAAAVDQRTPGLDSAVTHFTDLGSTTIMPVIAVVASGLLVWLWRSWTPALLMAIAVAGSLALTVVGKNVVARARPDHDLAVPPFETTASFPSGHALNSWVIFAMIAYLVVCQVHNRTACAAAVVVAVVLSVAMGLSRVYLGHHWLTDVLVAWTLGTAWLVAVITGHRLAVTVIRSRRRRQTSTGAPIDA